ncbi:type VI secretion system baseplate subunit TssG [Desulfobacter curvatus]|uniref:type VI secretion system baseplate subunit TssG n=1 Tax=Desulfobacter curvatus TaxID=2290 RepID=UPI00036E9C77|nr:type VI secretion system baseplate subunit TssG [Desulfobacter curvatus]
MAQTKLKSEIELEESISAAPWEWNFFLLIRELDRFFDKKDQETEPTGFSYKVRKEALRFRQKPSLAFPPSDVAGYRPGNDDQAAEMMVNCFGLLGCNGPMPLFLTEYVFERSYQHKDHALRNFLDIFHHRMISLYYRAWAINQITVNRDWQKDPFSDYIGALINIKGKTRATVDDIPKDARLYYSGRLIQKDMNVEGLCAILKGYFGTRVLMEQFTGQWIPIPRPDRFRLAESEDTGLMGQTCIIGRRIWDVNQKFRLVLGPMKLELYEKMVPGSKGFSHLKSWVDNYVGMSFDWDVQLILSADEIPDFTADKKIKLGYTSWFKKRKDQKDADNLILSGNR